MFIYISPYNTTYHHIHHTPPASMMSASPRRMVLRAYYYYHYYYYYYCTYYYYTSGKHDVSVTAPDGVEGLADGVRAHRARRGHAEVRALRTTEKFFFFQEGLFFYRRIARRGWALRATEKGLFFLEVFFF